MTASLDIGLGFSSVEVPGRADVVRTLDAEAATIFSLEESRDAAKRGRGMGGGASDTRLMDVTMIRMARDVCAEMTDEDFARLLERSRKKRREAA